MPNDKSGNGLDIPGGWAKRYFLASRAVMEQVLCPFDLGNTQWYVLHRLSEQATLSQRDLTRELDVERATLSTVIGSLVRKGLVEQVHDPDDRRQRTLRITSAGAALYASLPDPIALLTEIAFAGVDPDELETMNRVLSGATKRLTDYRKRT